MSIKPILFNTEMVQAILDGKKTVTRRVIKLKYSNTHIEWKNDKYGKMLIELQNDVGRETHGRNPDGSTWQKLLAYRYLKAPYTKGDILYVRETWTCWRAHRYEANADIKYKAGGEDKRIYFSNGNTDNPCRDDYDSFVNKWYSYAMKWRPSIHMPKEAARIWLKVIDVRVERLQCITEEQAIKEGFDPGSCQHEGAVWGQEDGDEWTAKTAFIAPWDSTISKKNLDTYSWYANPWVWVIEFERCKKPQEGEK